MDRKRAALINDLSGFGRCSLGVCVPVLAAQGVECCPLPTAILSNHTGYDSFSFTDFTPYMRAYIDEWKKRGIAFDAIYSGFLGSAEQIGIVEEFFDGFGKNALKVVDPVMGDDGRAYTTFDETLQKEMKRLASRADVLTPNVTEMMILSDLPYPGRTTLAALEKTAAALGETYGCLIVLTGIENSLCPDVPENTVVNLCLPRGGKAAALSCKKAPAKFAGTGDMFASALTGLLLRGRAPEDAVRAAADFVAKSAAYTCKVGGDPLDGPFFEKFLKELIPDDPE